MSTKAHSKEKCPFNRDITLFESELAHMKQSQDNLKEIVQTGFRELKEQFKAQNDYNDKTYVRRDDFSKIEKIVYGGIATVLLTLLGILINTFWKMFFS